MKTNSLARDFIAIDTNVFEGLLNPQKNTGDHIGALLTVLALGGIRLLVDGEDGRIVNEYRNRLALFFDRQSGSGGVAHQDHLEILRYWFRVESHKEVGVNYGDALMNAIKAIMDSGSATDRTLAYVAINENRILVTNDRKDFIDLGNRREQRRQGLLRLARQRKKKQTGILTSQEAMEVAIAA